MAKLKMVAGRTFMCPPLFGAERVITRGEVVDVPDDKAGILLDETYTDMSNNTHHYFVVDDGSTQDSEAATPAKATKRTRVAA